MSGLGFTAWPVLLILPYLMTHRIRTHDLAWWEDQADVALSSAAVPRPAVSSLMPLR
jgi:hypothetical protein